MASKKLEYDSSLGGPVVLGTHLPTYKYAASALKEMKELVSANQHSYSNKLVFQSLPKHMRRRAMSHHPKRLPRKYRAAHIHQMSKSGKPQATKRSSRKHRRRPKNLLRDYLRRQRKHKWLETHIWHAKRFHMIEKWGYKLPYASCDKTYRACYRASAQHCLLQDVSFYACVEVIGTLEELTKGFQRLTSKECGLSITAKTFLTGRREGCVDIFKDSEYPYKALGKVTFLWRCEDDEVESNCKKTIWLWIHPSAYITILEEFIKVFDLKNQIIIKVPLDSPEEIVEESAKDKDETDNISLSKKEAKTNKKEKIKSQRRLQFMTKTSSRLNTPFYKNAKETIELKELRGTLNRFRLTGPLAQSILQRAFQVKHLTQPLNSWIAEAIENKADFLNYHQKQQEFWLKCHKCITSPGELLSNMVLALNIEDPRIHRPQKRSKAITMQKSEDFSNTHDLLVEIKPLLSSSQLWIEKLRNRISSEMLSSQEHCNLRAKHVIVPGKPCKFEDSMQPVPVLLIQRPGSQDSDYKRLGYGCGWDIIIPAGYGMPIWLSLIMWGARPGGLREFDSIAREMGTEEHLPDTVGGLQVSGDRYNELHTKYFRLPPNKRCNYQKFSIISPFRIPFVQLIRDWCSSPSLTISNNAQPQNMYILRDRQKLKDLEECVKKCNLYKFPQNLTNQCLIQIKATMKSRGNPKDFSVICLPTKKDFKRNLKQIKLNNQEPVYVEPLLSDPNEKERNQLRMQHKKLLKRLRARRVREKRKKQETSNTKVYIRSAGTSIICLQQFKKMSKLWLHEDTSTLFSVRKQGTRDCFGYVSSAHFCLTEGLVGCIGYITVEGLKQLLKLCQQCHLKHPLLLIRSTNSRNYRFAQFKINLQV